MDVETDQVTGHLVTRVRGKVILKTGRLCKLTAIFKLMVKLVTLTGKGEPSQ